MVVNAYEKPYRVRMFDRNYAVSVPPEVIRKEAKSRGLTVKEFLKRFVLVAKYNSFDGILYQFREAEEPGDEPENT